jgi:hypothetical protein
VVAGVSGFGALVFSSGMGPAGRADDSATGAGADGVF